MVKIYSRANGASPRTSHLSTKTAKPGHRISGTPPKTQASTSIKVMTASLVLTASFAITYLLSCDLDKDKKWTCGDYSLTFSRIASLSSFLKSL